LKLIKYYTPFKLQNTKITLWLRKSSSPSREFNKAGVSMTKSKNSSNKKRNFKINFKKFLFFHFQKWAINNKLKAVKGKVGKRACQFSELLAPLLCLWGVKTNIKI